jgi:hypothetical protein
MKIVERENSRFGKTRPYKKRGLMTRKSLSNCKAESTIFPIRVLKRPDLPNRKKDTLYFQ